MEIRNGNIGVIYWYEEVVLPMTEEERQYIIDQDTKAALYALSQSATLNPNQGYIEKEKVLI